MPTLYQLIPDVEVLLALAPADLAPALLTLARDFSRLQQRAGAPASFIPEELTPDERLYSGIQGSTRGYSLHKRPEIELALAEAWHWLAINELILPAPGINGRNGRKVLSRQGASLATDEDLARFKEAAAFPKALLHPAIGDKVRLALARGDLDDAVFIAFKAVEVGLSAMPVGLNLPTWAWPSCGKPLTKQVGPCRRRPTRSPKGKPWPASSPAR